MKTLWIYTILCVFQCCLAAKRSNGASSNRVRTTTTTTQSTIIPEEWRDPYIYSLFEMTLSAIDSKLRRVDNLDRAMEQLMRRVDSIDSRLSDTAARSDAILSQLKSMDHRLSQMNSWTSGSSENLEPRILALDEKVSVIGSKLNVLAYQLDSNSLLWNSHNDSADYASASEHSRTYAVPIKTDDGGDVVKNNRNDDVDSLRTALSSMDRHLKILIELFSEQMDKMLGLVTDVRTALVGQEIHETTSTTQAPPSTETPVNTSVRTSNSKIDALFQKMSPLLDVSEKMDEVWNVLVGTKTSVDTLVPTSEALLWQTQRQERAISDIHTDLNVKTKQIIENLNLVERQLVQQRESGSGKQRLKSEPEPSDTTHKASESQVHVTYKQTEGLANRGTIIRAQELSPGLVGTKPSGILPSGSLLTLPTDIMDSEFLHDDPITAFKSNSTNTTAAASSSNATSSTTATSGIGNIGTTTTVRSIHTAPAGPTERSRIPTNSAVIFPSVKNKPGFTNSTFFYDYTTPQNIRGYSCAEFKEQGLTKSGIYYLLIRGTSFWYLKVYCDMETANGGWTVIQRRDDYGENRENFNRDWDDYKSGFGDPDREFWLGNENIYMLTNAEDYSLRVELEDFEGNKRYAEYSSFKLYSEREQYKLEIGGYTGNAGDSLNDPWYGSNLSPFSTYNRDNDRSSLNCASMLKGGWWWKSCGRGLNGIYLTDPQDLTARQGIVWFRWRGWDYTLKRATMMIRPRHYGKESSTPSP